MPVPAAHRSLMRFSANLGFPFKASATLEANEEASRHEL
jgi:hypothetical protein